MSLKMYVFSAFLNADKVPQHLMLMSNAFHRRGSHNMMRVVTNVPKTIVKLTAYNRVNDLFWTSRI